MPADEARDSASAAIARLPVAALDIAVWRVDLAPEPAPAALALLSASEAARAARFVFAADRRRFRGAHAALRELIAAHVGMPAAALEFSAGVEGKPAIRGCVFNMSHSAELALVAIATDAESVQIGVDVEGLRPIDDAQSLAARHFTPAEQAELARAPAVERDRVFLRGWTRKEACLKALGSGLMIAPSTFECGLAPARGVAHIPTSAGVRAVEVESIEVDAGHVGAVARMRDSTPYAREATP